MKIKVNDLREFFVFPSSLYSKMSKNQVTGYSELDTSKNYPWWKNSYFLHFGENDEDLGLRASRICSECKGKCCKNIIDHQIRIYISDYELENIANLNYPIYIDGKINIKNDSFYVVSVDQKGDCRYLREDGCLLSDNRPLWCKMFFCEKIFGNKYLMEE